MSTKLEEYKRKRDFDISPEPFGEAEEPGGSLRFAVQHHIARKDHYDFRLEWEGVLLSWAIPKGPSYNTQDKRLAIKVEDHPLEYRNFEGTIPQGEYGGGVVMLWDEGYWEPYGNVEDGLSKGELKFSLDGSRLKGKWALIRLKNRESDNKDNWLLLKERDEFAKSSDGISGFNTSIRTGRTIEEIERGAAARLERNPFSSAEVQLCKLVSSVPEGEDWLYELKYDGYRILAYVEAGKARLMTRNGIDYTQKFKGAAAALTGWAAGRAMVLDGEMTVTDASGKTDFQALQSYLKNPAKQNLCYIIFDLLAYQGEDLRSRPLIQRKELLETLMQDAPATLRYSRHVRGGGSESFAAACSLGMEGIVGKRAQSVYSGTRNGDWIKLKCDKRQEFLIGAYSLTDKRSEGISSLLLGIYEGDRLIYTGRAGTGISEAEMKELINKFKALIRPDSPFASMPEIKAGETIIWLEPELLAEIKFAEWTKEGLLRQASYKGLRTDKKAADVRREGAESEAQIQEQEEESRPMAALSNDLVIQGVRITHPDKLLFEDPEITKEAVIRYYERAAERMLPYVSRRPLSIVRCPKGIGQACFYKKHPGQDSKGIATIPIASSDGSTEEYFYIENIVGLISEAQMGTLEFHTWSSTADRVENPDIMVFDLDPDEGMELNRIRQGVRDLKEILSELSLSSYLKTSGGKGYHVLVPFKPAAGWDPFHDFAKRVAEVMENKWPQLYTSNVRKAKRTDKIFIDWIRNSRGATSIAPYSLRARKGAKVSMPIGWDELDLIAPDGVDIFAALERLSTGDPWQDFFMNNQILK
jgi:bifunctional non-homologous end joining protein LigD